MRKQDNIISLPRDKMSYRSWENSVALRKHTWWVNYWLCRTKTKPNTTVFHSSTITANIWENSKKFKQRTHVKINLKTRNRVISSPRDEKCITALRKEDESRKSKRRKTSQLFWDQSYFNCVKLVATLALFPAVL